MSMGFLYFLSEAKGVSDAQIAKGALAGLVDSGVSVSRREVLGSGPSGKPGLLIRLGEGDCEFKPQQKWQKRDENGTWMLAQGENPPSAFLRDEAIDGYWVKLADENQWIVPIARVFPTGSKLPQSLILGPGGKVVSEVLPRFAQACSDAERIWRAVAAANSEQPSEADQISQEEGFFLACRILAINYRLGPPEVSLLRLLDTYCVQNVIRCFVDWPKYVRAELARLDAIKKNSPAEIAGTSVGSPGSGEC